MQAWSGQSSSETLSPARKLTTTIVLVFSLAGLIAGFAFGGLTHSRSNTTNPGSTQKLTPVVRSTNTVTPTATPAPVILLGFPQFNPFPTTSESAAGGTVYTVGMQAVDKQNKPVHSSDITCKLWLVQQIPANQKLDIDTTILKTVNTLNTPIQGTIHGQPAPEVVGGLTFAQSTPQTGLCNPNGQVTWKYTVAPTLPPGNYDLVILADWKGIHFNWSWDNITIKPPTQ